MLWYQWRLDLCTIPLKQRYTNSLYTTARTRKYIHEFLTLLIGWPKSGHTLYHFYFSSVLKWNKEYLRSSSNTDPVVDALEEALDRVILSLVSELFLQYWSARVTSVSTIRYISTTSSSVYVMSYMFFILPRCRIYT